jgi:signal transduction histidine kinase
MLLIVAGLAFANSVSVARVTNNARSLHWANATLGTAALTRAGLVQAVTFAELQARGMVDEEDLAFAMEQVIGSTGELEQLLELGGSRESFPSLTRFVAQATTTVDDLSNGDVAAAKERIKTGLEVSYNELVDSLSLEQQSIQDAIQENSDDGKALNAWVVFILTLAIPGSAVVVYFVIARRQMRALRERSQLELEAERTISRAKDDFIAGLSHELRTPLTSIYGFAEILAEGGVQGPEATTETAQIIANEASEMTRMVDDLLAASRLAGTGVEIEMARTNIRDVVDAALTPFLRAGMNVDWEPTSVFVSTDAARLKHIVTNLLSNAVRHGGPAAGIDVTQADNLVAIEVWDNGPGVSEDRIDKLFDRFVHTDDAPLLTGSVGLGLAVASRLAGLMGGGLRYQRYGGKTFFIVTLPGVSEPDDDLDSNSVAAMIRALSG